MEIKLSAGDKIQVPANCKATIEDNLIIIEEQKEEFKRGDVIVSKTDEILLVMTYDFDSNLLTSFVNIDVHDNLFNNPYQKWNVCHEWRLATEEEKQRLFDALKEAGLRWNAETKEMEKIRRIAEWGETYLFIDGCGKVCETTEAGLPLDYDNYNVGNYYFPEEREQAEEDAKALKAIFGKRLKVK